MVFSAANKMIKTKKMKSKIAHQELWQLGQGRVKARLKPVREGQELLLPGAKDLGMTGGPMVRRNSRIFARVCQGRMTKGE